MEFSLGIHPHTALVEEDAGKSVSQRYASAVSDVLQGKTHSWGLVSVFLLLQTSNQVHLPLQAPLLHHHRPTLNQRHQGHLVHPLVQLASEW